MKYLKLAFSFLASYSFATVLFVLLLILTFMGTLEQVRLGLYETQKRFFDSLFVWVNVGHYAIPVLPGVYLLLLLLVANLVAGGVIRIRKGKSTVGVLIAHLGILFLLFGGFLNYAFAENGEMTLFEHERSNTFESYYNWQLAIHDTRPNGEIVEYQVPGKEFQNLRPGESKTLTRNDLPIELTLYDYQQNSTPLPKGPMFTVKQPVIGGFFLAPKPLEKEAERNVAGAYLVVTDKATGAKREGIIWGLEQSPLAFQIGGDTWSFDLRKQRTLLPFTIQLDKFYHKLYPGTDRAEMFKSDVTKIQGGIRQKYKIRMNEPLRYDGYTFYQSGWGPQKGKPGRPLFSTFSVVKNPADKFPLIACVIVTFGLLLHFGQKLTRYLRSETKRLA